MTLSAWVPPPLTQLFNMLIGEYGQDYAVPVGKPIYSPVAGIVGTENSGAKAWGKRVLVHAASGLSFGAGHLSQFVVTAGQHVQVGQLLGYTGNTGVSTGPHVELQFFTAAGKYLDPAPIFAASQNMLQLIFTGKGSASSTSTLSATSASSSSNTTNPFNPFNPFNPLQAPQWLSWEFTHAVSGVTNIARLGFWVAAGLGIATLGLLLIFFGDIEKGIDKATDAASKAGGAAADVAAPEVAIPAQAAARTAGAVA